MTDTPTVHRVKVGDRIRLADHDEGIELDVGATGFTPARATRDGRATGTIQLWQRAARTPARSGEVWRGGSGSLYLIAQPRDGGFVAVVLTPGRDGRTIGSTWSTEPVDHPANVFDGCIDEVEFVADSPTMAAAIGAL